MIVASFFAPRFEKWPGCDYVDCLKLLQASCDKLGLRHVLISDRHFDGFDTFVQPLPVNLMRAFLEGQRNFVAQLDGPALLVGADCLLTKSPLGVIDGRDAAFTVYPRRTNAINNGAVWVAGPHCAKIWDKAIEFNPVQWGDDQRSQEEALAPIPDRIKKPWDSERLGLKIRFLPCEQYNWFPDTLDDDGNMATVVHFKGNKRKKLMRPWAEKYLGIR